MTKRLLTTIMGILAVTVLSAGIGPPAASAHVTATRSISLPAIKLQVLIRSHVVHPGDTQVFTVTTAPDAKVRLRLRYKHSGWHTLFTKTAHANDAGLLIITWLVPSLSTTSLKPGAAAAEARAGKSGTTVHSKTCASSSGEASKCKKGQFIIARK